MSRTAGFLLEYVTYRIFSPTGNPDEPYLFESADLRVLLYCIPLLLLTLADAAAALVGVNYGSLRYDT
jgi:hypothetical protein